MALLNMTYFSRVLKKKKHLVVEYPFIGNENIDSANILLFLHGLGDNSTDLLENYGIKSIAEKNNLIVVCTDCDRSWYTNMPNGYSYFDYIKDEVLGDVSNLLNINLENRKIIVAGISMGGYGALKMAINSPEKVDGVVAISPAVDVQNYIDEFCDDINEMKYIFGDVVNNVESVVENSALLKQPTYIACGKDDFLIHQNRKFQETLTNEYTYIEKEGVHDWDFFLPNLIDGIQKINDILNAKTN